MYLHLLVHNYILKFYSNGFHQRNGSFPKNGFAVPYARTAGTREPEYSASNNVYSRMVLYAILIIFYRHFVIKRLLGFYPELLVQHEIQEASVFPIPLQQSVPEREICLVIDETRPLKKASEALIHELMGK